MAKVIAIGQPVNDSERQAIVHLRDHLPDTYTILHNFEIQCGNELFEVDLAVVAPHTVYLVDVKGTRGNIDVYGGKWYPERRQPFSSPLPKLRGHAKTLSGLIADHNHADPNLRRVYCDAAVILTAPDAHLSDPTGKDAPHTTTLAKCVRFFQDASQIPDRFLPNIARYTAAVIKVIQGSAKPVIRPPQYGDWIVAEKLGGTDLFTEYRAYNALAGEHGGSVLLRVYPIDPYAAEDERQKQRRRIENAYRALSRLPSHSAVQAAKGFFATEDDDRYILVVEDMAGQALRLHIEKPALALTFDQKLRIARDLLAGLAHAHRHEVVHRNICPSTILYGADGQTRLINFDHARSGSERTSTIGGQIVDELEAEYQAPECFKDPSAATAASDMFSVGVVLYELFTGERPFSGPSEVFDQSGVFAVKPSQHQPELPEGFDEWLQDLCAFSPANRPGAATGLVRLEEMLKPKPGTSEGESSGPPVSTGSGTPQQSVGAADAAQKPDYLNLPAGYELTRKYVVQERLGKPGGFGVVYKVIDTLGDVSRAVKLILQDRSSTVERLRQEYRPLLRLPEHRYVVRVVDADFLPGDGTPYLVFEFVHGTDVGQLIETRSLTRSDAWELGKQILEGLIHLHANRVYHCDIKPRNLLWTDHGVKILDFNVAVMAAEGITQGGGTRRYLPPDYDLAMEASAADLADRDLFATGITLFEAMTGRYPWDAAVPPPGTAARDPRDWTPTSDLAPAVVELLLRSVAPRRADRFQSPEEMLRAMQTVKQLRIVALDESEGTLSWQVPGAVAGPNHNPFVDFLLTRYSQGRNNQGTRGLDTLGGDVYVDTALDRELTPATLSGEFRLVVITGNAGDGKTAFLEKLQRHAEERGAVITPAARGNGAVFGLDGRQFLSNYDGSQDEGDVANEAVLHEFLGPFQGTDSALWPRHETRLIAINEGRLIDFLQQNAAMFPLLMEIAKRGLDTGVPEDGVALVNLNLRSVVAPGPDGQPSLLERLIGRLTQPKFWNRCEACDLRDRCYVLHNVKTFQDETAGPLVTQRLQALYTLTSLRGRLHITLRDLGSAMAFNRSGRTRLRSDTTLRPTKCPRGLILATGEDIPPTHSIRARCFILEMGDDLKWAVLTECQKDAAAGRYSAAMAGFIHWVANHYDSIRDRQAKRVPELRQRAHQDGMHRRTPAIIAELYFALEVLVDFAIDAGAMSFDSGHCFLERAWCALGAISSSQEGHQKGADPVERFLSLLRAAINSGHAHLASSSGAEPENPSMWGWRERKAGIGVQDQVGWHALGDRIGWVQGDDAFLDQDATYRILAVMAANSSEGVAVTARTLAKRLKDRGLLVVTEEGRCTVRVMLEGKRQHVLHLRADTLFARGLAQDENVIRHSDRGQQETTSRAADGVSTIHADCNEWTTCDPRLPQQVNVTGPAHYTGIPSENLLSASLGPVGPVPETQIAADVLHTSEGDWGHVWQPRRCLRIFDPVGWSCRPGMTSSGSIREAQSPGN